MNKDKTAFYSQDALSLNVFEDIAAKAKAKVQHQQIIITKKDRRHLGDSLSNVEGRRLRSAFDVFDFVHNAVSSGVNKAKKDTKNVVKSLSKQLKPAVDEISKDVKKLEDISKKVIKEEIDKGAKLLVKPVDEVAQKVAEATKKMNKEIAKE